MNRWKPNVTVATVVERENTNGEKQYLLVHEVREGKAVYNQPAGHLDEGESLCDAAIRETLEETGWDIELQGLIGIYRLVAPNGITYLRHAFSAKPIAHHPEKKLDDGIIEAIWCTQDEITQKHPQMRSHLVQACIDDLNTKGTHPLSIFNEE